MACEYRRICRRYRNNSQVCNDWREDPDEYCERAREEGFE